MILGSGELSKYRPRVAFVVPRTPIALSKIVFALRSPSTITVSLNDFRIFFDRLDPELYKLAALRQHFSIRQRSRTPHEKGTTRDSKPFPLPRHSRDSNRFHISPSSFKCITRNSNFRLEQVMSALLHFCNQHHRSIFFLTGFCEGPTLMRSEQLCRTPWPKVSCRDLRIETSIRNNCYSPSSCSHHSC